MSSGIYQKEFKTYVHTQNLYIDVYSSFIHNWQNLEVIKMFWRKRMDE